MRKEKEGIQARLRLVTVDGEIVSTGYRSGRRRWRDTPVTNSIARTRSAGTTPRESQLETVLCRPNPKRRAKALCPPAAAQASKIASLHMSAINAQTVNTVNAGTVNSALHAIRMGRQSESEPSAFWRRLTEAWSEQDLPTSQNGVATKLKMSQGSVGRWYHGEGLPELDTCIDIAQRGKVCVDWLLTGRLPKYPISKDPMLRELIETVEALEESGRMAVLRAARGEFLQKQADDLSQERPRRKPG